MRSAIKYKQYLTKPDCLNQAVVMSPPDTQEGNTDVDEAALPAVVNGGKDNIGSTDEQAYTKAIIERFDKDDALKLLIVVDKLLTVLTSRKHRVVYRQTLKATQPDPSHCAGQPFAPAEKARLANRLSRHSGGTGYHPPKISGFGSAYPRWLTSMILRVCTAR